MSLGAILKRILKNDKRRAPRLTCNMDASIRPKGSFRTKHCRVLDISDLGVRVSADNPHEISDTFCIFLNKGAGREAHVKWRRSSEIGAELTPATTSEAKETKNNSNPVLASVLAGAAATLVLLIGMYKLAGLPGAEVALGMSLIFVAFRIPA